MSAQVSIINYGLGNIKAFQNIFNDFDIPNTVASSPKDILDARRLICPALVLLTRP